MGHLLQAGNKCRYQAKPNNQSEINLYIDWTEFNSNQKFLQIKKTLQRLNIFYSIADGWLII